MSDPSANGVVTRYSVKEQMPVLDELLNGVMTGTMKPDAAKAALSILHHPLLGLELAIKLRRVGLNLSDEMAHALGLNGMAALPEKTETKAGE